MAEGQRIYETIEPVDPADAAAALLRNNPAELLYVVIGVGLYSDDPGWAEHFCLKLVDHTHCNVRGNAVMALGSLARRFACFSNPKSLAAVQAGLVDPDDYVREQSGSAADDVEWFAKLQIRFPDTHQN